jgi:hypothetical protein
MDAGDWIAIGALVAALVSLFFTAAERRTRTTEIELLRRQVKGEEEARAALQKANLVAAHGHISGGAPLDEHAFSLLNAGPAIARAIDVWARKEATGEDVTARLRIAAALIANESVTLHLMIPQADSRQGGLTLWAQWRDDSGDREEELLPIHKHG